MMHALTAEPGTGRRAPRLLVAGGGTGGHLFPGMAVVKELEARVPGLEVLFVGSARGIEVREVPRRGYKLALVPVGGLVGKNAARKLWNFAKLPFAFLASLRVLLSFRPNAVLGVGGYASGPTVLTAALLGVPSVIQEQNLVPGFTNKVLAMVARRVAVSFEETQGFFGHKGVVTGNPVRPEFARVAARPAGRMKQVLVFGGSQGARRVNEAVVAALPLLRDACRGVGFLHQTGEAERDAVEAAYRENGLSAEVVTFIQDMAGAMEASDLVICRSGASTVSELLVARRPAILIPLGVSAGGHQEKNARALERRGAARVLLETELGGERLAAILAPLFHDPSLVDRMALPPGPGPDAASGDAASKVADLVLPYLGHGSEQEVRA